MPANLENSAVATGLEKVSFPPSAKERQWEEYSNYHTIALISHAGKVMLKILQARLQQYMNRELPVVQAGFRKDRGTRDPNPAEVHHQLTPSPETPGHHRQVSYGVAVPSSLVLVYKTLLCPPRVHFPVLCKFRQLCGRVNGDILQEGLCHTWVYCTQSPCP